MDGRVPVTLVTGALGAGKSTLLRRVLTEHHGSRIAVIENEFADDVGIESLILKDGVEGGVAGGWYELANGCLCCSSKDGLVVVSHARAWWDHP
jgi:G3E family GTPase